MKPGLKISAGILGGLLLFAMLLPSRATVTRAADIDAPPATVFALVNDFGWIREWSARMDDDPNVRTAMSGPPRGVGAAITWTGSIIGRGSESIVASEPYARVETKIDLDDGRETGSVFEIESRPGGAVLRWTYSRDYGFNLPARVYVPLHRRLVGAQMDSGLARLQSLAQTLPDADFASLEVEHFVEQAQEIAYRRATSFPEASAISAAMADAFFDILNFIDRYGLAEAGAPMSISRSFSGAELVFDAAIPVRNIGDQTPAQDGAVSLGATYEGPVVRGKHIGPYSTLSATHDRIIAYLAAMRLSRNGDAWEEYVSDPTRTPEGELVTFVYYPVEGE